MTDTPGDARFWEQRWAQALRDHPDAVASRPPNSYLVEEATDLEPGRALDAGCGHGAESMWLAARGWQVTAVDFSATALGLASTTAAALGSDVAERIAWVEVDLSIWAPEERAFDLVSCLYVHVAGDVGEMVNRLGSGVAPGGTLLLVGHMPVDPATGLPTPAADQVQVGVVDATQALDPGQWDIVIAEERPRRAAGSGVDAVIRATRRT